MNHHSSDYAQAFVRNTFGVRLYDSSMSPVADMTDETRESEASSCAVSRDR
jgi:hypothetical protein